MSGRQPALSARVATWTRRHSVELLLWLVLAGMLAGTLHLVAQVGRPFGGYMVLDYPNTGEWVIDGATPPWWPAMAPGSLRIEDRLRAVDGNPDILRQGEVYRAAQSRGAAEVEVRVERAGQTVSLQLPVAVFSLRRLLEFKLPDVIIGLSFWLLAVVILRQRPEDPLNRSAAVVSGLAAALLTGWRLDLFEATAHFPPWLWLPELLRITANPFLWPAALSVALWLTLPESQTRLHPTVARWVRITYLIAGITTLIWWTSRALLWIGGWTPLVGLLDNIPYRIALTGGAAVLLFVVVHFACRLRDPRTSLRVKRRIRGILVGVAIAFPMMVMNYLAGLFLSGTNFGLGGLDLRYLYLAIPLAVAFVILRYQVFRGAHPLFLAVLLLAAAALLASIGDWLVRRSLPVVGLDAARASVLLDSGPQVPPFTWLLLIVLAGGLLGVGLPLWLKRQFNWRAMSYGGVRRFSAQMLQPADRVPLPQEIVATLTGALALDRAALWLWDPERDDFALAGSAGVAGQAPPARLAAVFRALRRPTAIGIDSGPVPAWLTELRALGFEAVAPLSAPGSAEHDAPGTAPIGLLALGKRVDEEIFHLSDLEIIELVAQQAALFLLTAQQIARLREVPHQISEAQERERLRLAQELHDTIQQFLGRLPFYLQVSRNSARSRPEQTEALLARCIADVEAAAQTVRQIRGELAPVQLERQLTQPLLDLLERFRARTSLAVTAEIAPDVETRLSPATRYALYRVIQQALDNVDVHAHGATNVAVFLCGAERQVRFSITDDGCGFSEAQRAQAEAAGHFGLRSMRSRIAALGGDLTVTSGTQGGVAVHGWLPSS